MKLLSVFLSLVLVLGACCSKKEIPTQPQSEIPSGIQTKLDEYKKLAAKYRPGHLTRYTYKGNFVYYFPTRCCDQMSEVYDEKGTIICRPEGGFTGKGDGKCPDFLTERKDPKILWQDDTD